LKTLNWRDADWESSPGLDNCIVQRGACARQLRGLRSPRVFSASLAGDLFLRYLNDNTCATGGRLIGGMAGSVFVVSPSVEYCRLGT
jgi:hypothetical protein